MRLLERLFRKNCGALERFLTCFVRRLGAPYVVRLLERFLRIVRRLASIMTWQHWLLQLYLLLVYTEINGSMNAFTQCVRGVAPIAVNEVIWNLTSLCNDVRCNYRQKL